MYTLSAGAVNCIVDTDTPGYFITCHGDKSLRLWQIDKAAPLKIYDKHTDAVLGATMIDKTSFLSWSVDCRPRKWSFDLNNPDYQGQSLKVAITITL